MEKVLVVDDMESFHVALKHWLGGRVEVLSAYSIEEARRLFYENPDVRIILMDACVPGDKPNTLGLVHEIETSGVFCGTMIAISSSPQYRHQLVQAGCGGSCPKGQAAQMVEVLLDLVA